MRLIQIGLGIRDLRDRASVCAGRDERLMKKKPARFMAAANDRLGSGSQLPKLI